MLTLEDLPPDQRAVLQLVLQRGRSYEEIAGLLSIDRAAIRQRALDACELLTPDTLLPGPEHALVTDYLLGQLPAQVAEQVYAYIEAAQSDHEWALAIAARLAPLAARTLPAVPDMPEAPSMPPRATPVAVSPSPAASVPSQVAVDASPAASTPPVAGARPSPVLPALSPIHQRPRSSRRGGIVLISVVCVAIAAAVVIAVTGGGSAGPSSRLAATASRHHVPGTTAAQNGAQSRAKGSGTGTATAPAARPRLLAALNLNSPVGTAKTIGVAQVIREDRADWIVIDAQGVPPNGTHNAYGVWLYNSRRSAVFVGFVRNLVGANGKLAASGRLPQDAARFTHLLITLETHQHPRHPGEVVLAGAFREHR